jgi:hypothetical protein
MHDVQIRRLNPAVSPHPHLTDRRWIEVVHKHCQFDAAFYSSDEG